MHENRVRRRLDQRPERRFRELQRRLCALAGGETALSFDGVVNGAAKGRPVVVSLDDVVLRAGPQGRKLQRLVVRGRHHDHGQLWILRLHGEHRAHPRRVRKGEVHQRCVELPLRQLPQRLVQRRSAVEVEALRPRPAQPPGHQGRVPRIVFHQEHGDGRRVGGTGRCGVIHGKGPLGWVRCRSGRNGEPECAPLGAGAASPDRSCPARASLRSLSREAVRSNAICQHPASGGARQLPEGRENHTPRSRRRNSGKALCPRRGQTRPGAPRTFPRGRRGSVLSSSGQREAEAATLAVALGFDPDPRSMHLDDLLDQPCWLHLPSHRPPHYAALR